MVLTVQRWALSLFAPFLKREEAQELRAAELSEKVKVLEKELEEKNEALDKANKARSDAMRALWEMEKEQNVVVRNLFLAMNNPEKEEAFRILGFYKYDERQCYDSDWAVVYAQNGAVDYTTVVRRYGESRGGMQRALAKCSSVKEIRGLDQKNDIYYD